MKKLNMFVYIILYTLVGNLSWEPVVSTLKEDATVSIFSVILCGFSITLLSFIFFVL